MNSLSLIPIVFVGVCILSASVRVSSFWVDLFRGFSSWPVMNWRLKLVHSLVFFALTLGLALWAWALYLLATHPW